jgi:hypothetical protein
LREVFSVWSVQKLYNEERSAANKPIHSSERMLHKNNDRKSSVDKTEVVILKGLGAKMNWLAVNRQSWSNWFWLSPETAVREYEVGVTRPPACEDVSLEAEERPLLEDVTKRGNEYGDWEH